jgi:serine/threonine protein kinase
MSQQVVNNTITKQNKSKTSPLSCIDDYEFHRSLGKGSMGKVKLGIHLVTGEKV